MDSTLVEDLVVDYSTDLLKDRILNISKTFDDISLTKIQLQFSFFRTSPISKQYRPRRSLYKNVAAITELSTFSDVELYLLLEDMGLSSLFVSSSSGSTLQTPKSRDSIIRLISKSTHRLQANGESKLNDLAGDGTVIAAKFKGSENNSLSKFERQWPPLHRKLSEMLGTGTSHLPLSSDASTFLPVPMDENISRYDFWQQMPNKRLETEAIDRWIQLLNGMQLSLSPLACLVSRSWIQGAPWYSFTMAASSSKGFLSSSVILRVVLFVGGSSPSTSPSSWGSLSNDDKTLLDNNNQQQRLFWESLKSFLHAETVHLPSKALERDDSNETAAPRYRYVSNRLASIDCEPDFTVSRAVRESRSSLQFVVHDEFSISFPSPCALSHNYSLQLTISETIPRFYDMLLHTYRYQIRTTAPSHNPNGTDRSFPPSLVMDSPHFSYSLSDCIRRRPSRRRWGNSYSSQSGDVTSGICDKQLTWQLNLIDAGIPLLPTAEIVVVVQFTALKRFIRREHLPADASRGCLIPGVLAALTLHNNTFTNSSPLFQRTLLSESALLTMPIPDLSMPYNVILLTTTFSAFFLGSLINAFFRRRKD